MDDPTNPAGPSPDLPGGAEAWTAALSTSGIALVTSFKRDGQGVGTPVAVSVGDGRATFTTRSKSWKVKRIGRNPQVTLAPSDPMGNPLGDTVRGTARRMSEDEVREMRKGVEYHAWRFVYRTAYDDIPVSYEVRPAD